MDRSTTYSIIYKIHTFNPSISKLCYQVNYIKSRERKMTSYISYASTMHVLRNSGRKSYALTVESGSGTGAISAEHVCNQLVDIRPRPLAKTEMASGYFAG